MSANLSEGGSSEGGGAGTYQNDVENHFDGVSVDEFGVPTQEGAGKAHVILPFNTTTFIDKCTSDGDSPRVVDDSLHHD